MILAGESLTLLLQSLNVAVLGLELLPETSDLSDISSLGETCGVLATGSLVTFEVLDAVLKTENLEDHGIGAVEDERQEEREAAKVHVALGIELPSLDFHPICAKCSGSTSGGIRRIVRTNYN